MSAAVFIALAVAGGLGAVARMIVDGVLRSRISGAFPWATVIINLSGSLVLGLLAGLGAGAVLPTSAVAIAGTGFLGGYTTFSTATVETVRLAGEKRWTLAITNALGTLVAGALLAGIGLALGAALVR